MPGGGFGASDSMNKTIANNLSLIRKKKGFEVLKENASWNTSRRHYQYKSASKEQLLSIRQKMKRRRAVNLVKGILAMLTALGIGGYLTMWYFGLI